MCSKCILLHSSHSGRNLLLRTGFQTYSYGVTLLRQWHGGRHSWKALLLQRDGSRAWDKPARVLCLWLRTTQTVWFQQIGVRVESCFSELLACLSLCVHVTIITYLCRLWQKKKWLSYTLEVFTCPQRPQTGQARQPRRNAARLIGTGLQHFPVHQKETQRWAEPRTRLITYAQALYNDPFDFCMHFCMHFGWPRWSSIVAFTHAPKVTTIFLEIFKLPEIEGELNMCKQCVHTRLSFLCLCTRVGEQDSSEVQLSTALFHAKLFVTYCKINNGRCCLVYHMM